MFSKKIVGPKSNSGIAGVMAWLLIVTGSAGITLAVNATPETEVVGSGIASICSVEEGPEETLGAWNNSTDASASSSSATRLATPASYSAVGLTRVQSATAADLGSVPASKDLVRYISYPLSTAVETRTLITDLGYGDMISGTSFRIQAELFSLAGESPVAIAGSESEVFTPGSETSEYEFSTFAFPDTLLLRGTPYELRLYVWSENPEITTIAGFDDLSIFGEACLPGAPTVTDVSVTGSTADVEFSAPTVPGGSTITNYEYSMDSGPWAALEPASTTSPLAVPVTEAEAEGFSISIRAVTVAGVGAESSGFSYTAPGDPEPSPSPSESSPPPSGDIPVSVFNMPNLNGEVGVCANENENLIGIIDEVPGYSVDGDIVDFVDGSGDPTLASQLAASRFFFMTDMENSGIANPSEESFLPESAKSAFRDWTTGGGVMVMTGTASDADVRFLNNIYNWNLTNQGGATATEVSSNTSGTPFENATAGVSLGTPSATGSIGLGTVPNVTPMWTTSAGNAAVAVMRYGSGYVIYLGWDYFDSGPGCGANSNPWVTGIIPAALAYAAQLSESGLENTTTSGGDLKYTFSNPGTTYYVIVPSGSAAPTSEQIKSQADYGDVELLGFGSAEISANVERVFSISGLSEANDYTVYVVTEFDDEGTPAFSDKQILNFSTKPGIPTVESISTDEDGNVLAVLSPSSRETSYEYSIDGGVTWNSRSPVGTSGTWIISGLTPGTEYDIEFRSVFKNQRGAATPTASVTPVVAPGYLSSLTPSMGTLSPGFVSTTLAYQLRVSSSLAEIALTPVSSGSTIRVGGVVVVSGQQSAAIELTLRSTDVTVSVLRSIAGAVETVYTIQVIRASRSSAPLPVILETPPTPTTTPVRPRPSSPPSLPAPVQSPVVIPELAPTPAPEYGSISLMVPIEPRPGSAFSSEDPVPQSIIETLLKPLAYVVSSLSGSPELPALSPRESLAYENGEPVLVELVKTDSENGYVLRGDGWEVALEATDSSGSPLLLDESGNIILNNDRVVQFSGTGFAPGSPVHVWLFSEPTALSDVIADASGNFVGQSQLPEGIPTGEHTLQLNGLTDDGQFRSVALGVVVQPEPQLIAPAVPPVGFDLGGLLNWLWLLAGLVLIFFFILWRRRKKDEEDETAPDGSPVFASEVFDPAKRKYQDPRGMGPATP